MNSHKNGRTTYEGRKLLIERIGVLGLMPAASAAGISVRTARKWKKRFETMGAEGLPISSAGAESAVDHVVGQRMKRNGHIRWTRRGAHSLLQVRCAVLNGQDVRNFKRWYMPPTSIQAPATTH